MQVLNALRTANLLLVDISRGTALRSLTLGRDAQSAGAVGFIQPAQVGSVVFESDFSVHRVDAHKLKVHLMETVGRAFGLELDDFPDAGAVARQMDLIVAKMDPAAAKAMERELGLDKLGVSLHEVLAAMKEPGGDRDKKLMAALREEVGETSSGQERHTNGGPLVRFDSIGRYFI